MAAALSSSELSALVDQRPAWAFDEARNALHRRLTFATFGEALAAMVRIGLEADKADHHPEWSNVYGTVDIWLTTHDLTGVSNRDVNLAVVIDRMYPSGLSSDALHTDQVQISKVGG